MNLNYKPILDRRVASAMNSQKVYRFKNGYGASVVIGPYTYGGKDGLFELAVIKFYSKEPDDFELDYSTPITADVVGHLTQDEVQELLKRIEAL